MAQKSGILFTIYKKVVPLIYGLGASIVIIGALFKILHWQGANQMLTIGLLTEAGIFLLSAFEHLVIAPDEHHAAPAGGGSVALVPQAELVVKFNEMMSKAHIDQHLMDNLGKSLNRLTDTAAQVGDLSNAALATNEYAKNVDQAAKSLVKMNESYGNAMKAVSAMADASKDTGEYHKQMQTITKNLQALNSVYEMELKDADSHVKNMNKFYESLSGAMSGLSKVGDNTAKFTSELSKLTDNLTALNSVYGSMLTAMKGSK